METGSCPALNSHSTYQVKFWCLRQLKTRYLGTVPCRSCRGPFSLWPPWRRWTGKWGLTHLCRGRREWGSERLSVLSQDCQVVKWRNRGPLVPSLIVPFLLTHELGLALSVLIPFTIKQTSKGTAKSHLSWFPLKHPAKGLPLGQFLCFCCWKYLWARGPP